METKTNTKSIVIAVVVILLLVAAWYVFNNRMNSKSIFKSTVNVNPSPSPMVDEKTLDLHLPDGWEMKDKVPGVEIKLEKKTVSAIKPVVVLVKTTKKDEDNKVYVTKLIQGAKSAFTSLVITKDIEGQKDSIYTREMVGYYKNGQNRVVLKMNVYIKGSTVYTITGSRDNKDTSIDKEFDAIFASLFESKIK